MKKDNSYAEYIVYDVLGHLEDITMKPMFSGVGVYMEGIIIAFVADGELYFKSNDSLKKKYLNQGCHPFFYTKKGKDIEISYMSATEEMMEDRDIMADRAYESYKLSKK